METTQSSEDITKLDTSWYSSIWERYAVSEIFVLPSINTGKGTMLLLKTIDEGLADSKEAFNDVYARFVPKKGNLRLAEQYLTVLESKSKVNPAILTELEKKNESFRKMRAEMGQFSVQMDIACEMVAQLEVTKKVAQSMLSRQKDTREGREENAQFIIAMATGMSCIDKSWSEFQRNLKLYRRTLAEGRTQKAEFVINFETTFTDGTTAHVSTDINHDVHKETEVIVGGVGQANIKREWEDVVDE